MQGALRLRASAPLTFHPLPSPPLESWHPAPRARPPGGAGLPAVWGLG